MSDRVIEENNLVHVDGLSLGDIYNWAEIEVYYSSELHRYFWIEGEGCSCSWLGDGVDSLADMCDGTKESAARAVRSFAESRREGRDYYGDVASASSGVRDF